MKLKYIVIPFVTIVTLIGLYMLYRNFSYFYQGEVVDPVLLEPNEKFDAILDGSKVVSDVPFTIKTNVDEEGEYTITYQCSDKVALKQHGKTLLCDVKQPLDVDNRNIEDLVLVSRQEKLKTVPLAINYIYSGNKKTALKVLNVTVENNNIQEEE